VSDVFAEPPKISTRAPHVSNYRYKLLNPETNKPETWTRVTTFAKTLADTSALSAWGERMLTKGLAMQPNLLRGAQDWDVSEHKGAFSKLINAAKDVAGIKDGATAGTRMHDLSEAHDRGEELLFATPEELRDIEAYQQSISAGGLRVYREYIERFVAIPEFKVCGKLDRIYGMPSTPELSDYELVIGDVKTAKNVHYGWLEIAIQLALYAMATHYWDEDKDDWVPMPDVSASRAVVAHLPVGAGECTLYDVDLEIGREACEIARTVRELRARKDVAHPIASSRVESPYAARLRECASREELSVIWKEATAAGVWTKDLEMVGMARLKELG
jgi:hypothetical protein